MNNYATVEDKLSLPRANPHARLDNALRIAAEDATQSQKATIFELGVTANTYKPLVGFYLADGTKVVLDKDQHFVYDNLATAAVNNAKYQDYLGVVFSQIDAKPVIAPAAPADVIKGGNPRFIRYGGAALRETDPLIVIDPATGLEEAAAFSIESTEFGYFTVARGVLDATGMTKVTVGTTEVALANDPYDFSNATSRTQFLTDVRAHLAAAGLTLAPVDASAWAAAGYTTIATTNATIAADGTFVVVLQGVVTEEIVFEGNDALSKTVEDFWKGNYSL